MHISGDAQEMGVDQARQIIDWASSVGVRDVAVLGGEPSLYRHLKEVLHHASSLGLTTRLVTNGLRPFQLVLPQLVSARVLSGVHVSIDGNEEIHDRLRGAGTFARAVESVRQSLGLGLAVTVNMTVSRENVDTVPLVHEMFCESGVRRLNVHWMSPVGRAGDPGAPQPVDATRWASLLAWVDSLRNTGPHDYYVECQDVFRTGSETLSCAVGRTTNLQFFPDGSVFTCGMLVSSVPSTYTFSDGGLFHRTGESELTLVHDHKCTSCPARSSETLEPGISAGCIYTRITTEATQGQTEMAQSSSR